MTDETKMTEADLAMLGLYRHLKKNKDEQEASERAYFAEKMRLHRAKAREAKASGTPRTTPGFARDALADAAMRILASNGPGSDAVREALLEAFAATPAYVATIEAMTVKGRLKTKLISLRKPTPERSGRNVINLVPDAPKSDVQAPRPNRPSPLLAAVAKSVADDADFEPPSFLLRDR